MIERIKTVLDIEDTLQDDVLDIFTENITSHLLIRLKRVNKEIDVVPSELDFIIEEIVVRRYNRKGSEGMQSESVEGHSITFYDLEKEFVPYDDIINDYADDDYKKARRG